MAMGKRKKLRQQRLWVQPSQLAKGPGHPFYTRLNQLLEEHGFDAFVEARCSGLYAETMGRPSLPPAVYWRLLLVGYFEGLGSERAIAWRLADSLSLRHFCGYELTDTIPDHSTLSRTRRLMTDEVHSAVFGWTLAVLVKTGLLSGKTLGVDATTLEASAAMRSIVRRDTEATYAEYLKQLAAEDEDPEPSRQELARRDRKRKKKTSNRDWKNPHDPEAKITRMKDGRTHLAYKAEHAVDLESGAVVAVTVQPADRGDTSSQEETLEEAGRNLGELLADEETAKRVSEDDLMSELVANRGYHSDAVLESCAGLGLRSYIPEPKRPRRRWRDRKEAQARLYANRRRTRGIRGRKLARLRAERVERTFAHCYETGGLRRVHLRGRDNVRKRVLIHVAAFNLGLVMRQLLGAGTPRGFQTLAGRLLAGLPGFQSLLNSLWEQIGGLLWPNPEIHSERAWPKTGSA